MQNKQAKLICFKKKLEFLDQFLVLIDMECLFQNENLM